MEGNSPESRPLSPLERAIGDAYDTFIETRDMDGAAHDSWVRLNDPDVSIDEIKAGIMTHLMENEELIDLSGEAVV